MTLELAAASTPVHVLRCSRMEWAEVTANGGFKSAGLAD